MDDAALRAQNAPLIPLRADDERSPGAARLAKRIARLGEQQRSDINPRLIAFFAESGKELLESLKEQFTRDLKQPNNGRELIALPRKAKLL